MVKKTIWDNVDSYWDLDLIGSYPFVDDPKGITVHYTASGSLESTKNEMATKQGVTATNKGYHVGYHFVIDRAGLIHQTASLGKAVNHAGNAAWNGQSPNRTHVAVAFISWGLLENGKAWTGMPIIGGPKDAKGNQWQMATPFQEQSLKRLIDELCEEFKITPNNICGHDECAIPKGRKIDPGGTLVRTPALMRKEPMS